MEEIIKNFGINPILLIAQIFNFLVVFYILKRFFYKKILDALKSRQQAIKEGLKQAEESRILLEKAEASQKQILRKAQEESRKLLEETRRQRDQILHEAQNMAKVQAQKILDETRSQIESETKQTQKLLALQISGLAVEFLQKSTSQIFSKEDHEKIIKKAIQKIKKRVD